MYTECLKHVFNCLGKVWIAPYKFFPMSRGAIVIKWFPGSMFGPVKYCNIKAWLDMQYISLKNIGGSQSINKKQYKINTCFCKCSAMYCIVLLAKTRQNLTKLNVVLPSSPEALSGWLHWPFPFYEGALNPFPSF